MAEDATGIVNVTAEQIKMNQDVREGVDCDEPHRKYRHSPRPCRFHGESR